MPGTMNLDPVIESLTDLVTKRMDENERMRAALEKIRETSFDPQSVDIATEALE